MTATNTDLIDFDELAETEDTLDLNDTWRLRLRVNHDYDYSINDYECDGKVSPLFDYRRDSEDSRPDGFTGRARKLDVDRGGFVWWEPHDGDYGYQVDGKWHSAKWDSLPADVQRSEVRRVSDLLEYGFYVLFLMLEERVNDSFGGSHWVTADEAALGGVESVCEDTLRDMYCELDTTAVGAIEQD